MYKNNQFQFIPMKIDKRKRDMLVDDPDKCGYMRTCKRCGTVFRGPGKRSAVCSNCDKRPSYFETRRTLAKLNKRLKK